MPEFEQAPIVILSSVDWDAAWQRHQIFASLWADAGRNVFFVENLGFREPRLEDWRRVAARLKGLLSPALATRNPRPDRVKIVSPAVLPPTREPFRKINQAVLAPRLADRLKALGMTNLLIKMLARKGYIKISQLDWKRTQYLLTLKGAFEKARKSYNYSVYTIRIFRQIRENVRTVLKREHEAGRREFTIVAQDEVLELVREAVADLSFADATFAFVDDYKDAAGELVLTATLEAPPEPRAGQRFIVLVDFRNLDFKVA